MIKMFERSYEQMTDVSIMEVKTYLLIHSEGVYQQDIYDLMNKCLDVSQLKRKLNKRKDLQLWLFTTIKRYIDLCIKGDSTIPERYGIIHSTKIKAQQQMEELQKQLDLLNFKESFYQNLIKNNLKDTWNPMNNIEINEEAV